MADDLDRIPEPRIRRHSSLGSLLVAVGEHMSGAAGTGLPATVTGCAATARTWSLATLNVAIHGIPVDLGDGPPADPREVDADQGRFDVVVLNPPFGRRDWSRPASRLRRPWPYGEPSPHNVAFAWLQTAVEALVPGGRAAVVMPYRATFGSTARERNIRGMMVKRGAVRCVVALPSHLFRETTVPVTVWILAHPRYDAGRDVLLIDARAAARKDGPTHRVLTERGCRAILDAYQGWLDGSATFSGLVSDVTATTATVTEIREHGYDLQPVTYLNQRRQVTAEQRVRLRTLPDELAWLDAVARAADLTLDRCLEKLAPWIR